jgi:hypothetical protein
MTGRRDGTMALDELRAELQDRIRSNRTSAVIARNTALDLAKRMERDISDLRRKLEHDELEDLDDGSVVSYSSFFTSDPFNLERNLVRIVHFLGEVKVAKHDLETIEAEGALLRLADRPIRGVVGEPSPAGGGVTVVRQNPEPHINHGFEPQKGARRYCAVKYEDQDKDMVPCGQALEFHKFLAGGYRRCSQPRSAHSVHPSKVDPYDSPHGHEFLGIVSTGSEDCQQVVSDTYPV